MKSRYRMVIQGMMLFALVLSAAGCQRETAEAQLSKEKGQLPDIKLIQATDLHYLTRQLTDNGSFFSKVVDSGDGKVMHYSEALIEAFVEQIIEEKPDYLLLTGDLTLNGERLSHEALSKRLRKVEEGGTEVIVMPGNHDLNNPMAVKYVKSSYEPVATVNASEFRKIYKDFGYNEAIAKDKSSLSYVYALKDKVWLLAVDVNTQEAPGQLKPETLIWVKQQLEAAKQAGVHVIGLSHQNLLQHNLMFSGGFVFEGSEGLLSLYERYGVICNLSGHMHVQHLQTSNKGFKEAATSSLAISPNQYAVLSLMGTELNYETKPVDVAYYARRHGMTDEALLNFKDYAARYFEDSSKQKIRSQLKGTPNTEAVAEYFAKLNLAYFSGRGDLYPDKSPLLELPEVKISFLSEYMKSLFMEPARDQNRFELDLSQSLGK